MVPYWYSYVNRIHSLVLMVLIYLSRQNNVTELYSLIKFLRIKPLSNWDTFNSQIAKPVNTGRGASRAMKRLQVRSRPMALQLGCSEADNAQTSEESDSQWKAAP
jgi:SNF2 family DNA or RNA helicase